LIWRQPLSSQIEIGDQGDGQMLFAADAEYPERMRQEAFHDLPAGIKLPRLLTHQEGGPRLRSRADEPFLPAANLAECSIPRFLARGSGHSQRGDRTISHRLHAADKELVPR